MKGFESEKKVFYFVLFSQLEITHNSNLDLSGISGPIPYEISTKLQGNEANSVDETDVICR